MHPSQLRPLKTRLTSAQLLRRRERMARRQQTAADRLVGRVATREIVRKLPLIPADTANRALQSARAEAVRRTNPGIEPVASLGLLGSLVAFFGRRKVR